MAIRYKVCGKSSGLTSCYGSINALMDKEAFDGIELELTNPETSHHDSRLFLDRLNDDEVREVLRMARATGFGEYIPRTLKQLRDAGSIHFSPDVPFYVVVAVTGFFRLWANHKEGMGVYQMLRDRGLDAYQALAGMATMHNPDKPYLYCFGEHSIVPWTIFNKESIAQFKRWPEMVGSLPSMADEIEETGRLTYTGRDEWFGATRSGNDIYRGYDDWPDDGHGCVTSLFLEGELSEYDHNYIKLDELVEEVKSWK